MNLHLTTLNFRDAALTVWPWLNKNFKLMLLALQNYSSKKYDQVGRNLNTWN